MPSNIPAPAISVDEATDSSLNLDGSLAMDFVVDAVARRVVREGVISASTDCAFVDGVPLVEAAMPLI
jgi:hypothetical protein